jgi:CubicO group peptidase (beta-lactamase class C family)
MTSAMRTPLLGASLLLLLAPRLAAQSGARPLSDFTGTYEDAPGHTLEIVDGEELFAVVDEARYRLKRAAGDVFTNQPGDTIPFRRDANGVVIGYVERGVLHRRLSTRVTDASAALVRAKPREGNAPYRYSHPLDRHDGIPVGDIASTPLGVETAERIVRGIVDRSWNDVHSVLLVHGGRLVLEEYFYGYGPERPHQQRSLTKSVVGALAGAAIDRGALPGVDTPVVPWLGYASFENPDPRKARITLGDLLTMRSGLACDDHDGNSPGRETEMDKAADWVKAALDLPMAADPGTVAHYCSAGVKVTGRVIERATHSYLPDFAHAALFGPLGMRRGDWRWNYTLTNANTEFSQIHLRPRDMLKIGMMYADSGRWRGRQVLSKSWVAASLAPQTQLENTGYGYLWWRPWLRVATPEGERRVEFNAAQGNGGQKIYLVPELDLIAVFTGGDYNSGGAPPNRIMASVILPRLLAARSRGQTR